MKLLFCGCCAFTFDQAGWDRLHSHSLTHQFSPPSQPSAASVLLPPQHTEHFVIYKNTNMYFLHSCDTLVIEKITKSNLGDEKRDLDQHTHAHTNSHTHIPPPSALSLWLTECCSTVWTSKGGWLYIHSVFSPCALNSSTSSKEERERKNQALKMSESYKN